MKLLAKIFIRTNAPAEIKKIKHDSFTEKIRSYLSFGRLTEEVQCESFDLLEILNKCEAAFRLSGIDNLIRLTHDDTDFYLDTQLQPHDLSRVVEHFRMDISRYYIEQYETLSLVLEHQYEGLSYSLFADIKHIHAVYEPPISITLTASPDEGLLNEHHIQTFSKQLIVLDASLRQLIGNANIYVSFEPPVLSAEKEKAEKEAVKTVKTGRADRTDKTDKTVNKPPKQAEKPTTEARLVKPGEADIFFPIYGVSLGDTTKDELAKLGKHCDLKDEKGKFFQYYVIENFNFWYDKNKAVSMYMSKYGLMPDRWMTLGFNWKHSYNTWIQVLKDIGCTLTIESKPQTSWYQQKRVLSARVVAFYQSNYKAYEFTLNFNYGPGVSVKDEETLYGLSLRVR